MQFGACPTSSPLGLLCTSLVMDIHVMINWHLSKQGIPPLNTSMMQDFGFKDLAHWRSRRLSFKALANEDTFLRTHCCRHKCFPACPCAQHLLRTQICVSGTQKCFWLCSETFCVRNKCFPVCAAQETLTTDKKLGLERFHVSVATKQTLPALLCQMHRAEIILHVKRPGTTCIAKARNCDF